MTTIDPLSHTEKTKPAAAPNPTAPFINHDYERDTLSTEPVELAIFDLTQDKVEIPHPSTLCGKVVTIADIGENIQKLVIRDSEELIHALSDKLTKLQDLELAALDELADKHKDQAKWSTLERVLLYFGSALTIGCGVEAGLTGNPAIALLLIGSGVSTLMSLAAKDAEAPEPVVAYFGIGAAVLGLAGGGASLATGFQTGTPPFLRVLTGASKIASGSAQMMEGRSQSEIKELEAQVTISRSNIQTEQTRLSNASDDIIYLSKLTHLTETAQRILETEQSNIHYILTQVV